MRTALYSRHVALKAKIIDFAGWEMPLHYQGIIQEHFAVRQNVGIFDVSHMGRILIKGSDAEVFLDYLSTNSIFNKANGSATYTLWCHANGGTVDDLIVYKQTSHDFFVVVNAANRQKDLEHLQKHAQGFSIQIEDRFQQDGILAIQGPKAELLVAHFFPKVLELKPMHFILQEFEKNPIVLSRTGYTGAGGFEIYAPQELTVLLWDRLLEKGKHFGISPIGLGARDTLRLEMGYALYGHELKDDIAPIESVSAWTVKWNKKDFLGKDKLQKLENSSTKRFEYGITLAGKGIAREGYPIYRYDKMIGKVTSGTFSPSLNKAIALILVHDTLTLNDSLQVEIRQHRVDAQVTALPFYKGEK